MTRRALSEMAFKAPFEEAISPVGLSEIENDRLYRPQVSFRVLTRPEFRSVLWDQWSLYREGLAETEEGKLLDAYRYAGNKWGGKYLRAPDIFFTILEKGKGNLIRLGDIAEVNEGRPTGANDFFYVKKDVAHGFGIEQLFLYEGLMKTKGFNRFCIEQEHLDRYFFCVDLPRNQIKGTNALKYIEYGELQGLHLRNTFAAKAEWYRFKVRPPAELVAPCGVGKIFFCAVNEAKAIASNSYTEFRVKSPEYVLLIWAILNSTPFWLQLEIVGRSSLGGGLLKIDPIEYRQLLVLDPNVLRFKKAQIECVFNILKEQKVKSIFRELGFTLCRQRHCSHPEHPYEHVDPQVLTLEQVQRASPDRYELDSVVFDVLGLTEEERLEVYKAVAQLVKERLVKARSV